NHNSDHDRTAEPDANYRGTCPFPNGTGIYAELWQVVGVVAPEVPAMLTTIASIVIANGITLADFLRINPESNDTLDSIASEVGLNTSVLVTWNPQLESTAPVANTSICVVFPMGNYTLYNATRPSNADSESTPDCAEWYTVVSGDGCASIEAEFGLTSAQFLELNPGVGADCTTLQLGVSYCVLSIYPPSTSTGPPSNLAAGSFTNSNISFSDLLRWNPELDTACETIELDEAYCVGGGGDACPKLYTVASGDYCSLIETNEDITAAELQALNPWLDSNCDLEVGQVLCVGPSTSPTQTTTMTMTTSATMTSTSAVATPTNIASGSWTNCTAYCAYLPIYLWMYYLTVPPDTVQSGDSCTAIDEK
ncbi:hypothetical protein EVJ58_g10948, partial [Rhodofomes roseus]